MKAIHELHALTNAFQSNSNIAMLQIPSVIEPPQMNLSESNKLKSEPVF